ncbi:MAG: tRNA glutamyl-Q(34) synthetase GluQRS [Rhodospirillales bacterium]|nr:tRNA glutamyl-Q(34) synthetase GluQRS [Rhodospirillales bacterium]
MIVTRFAPSPTGHLHLGHAYSALFAFEAAKEAGGRFLLRIEDIDLGRCRPEFIAAIFDDLAWLGLDWERPVRRQSEHFAEYHAALERLESEGLLYPCFCTRQAIAREIALAGQAPHGPDGPAYPGICRRLSADERRARKDAGLPYALRLDVGLALGRTGALFWHDRRLGRMAADPTPFGDVVLGRKDIPASYHLAVTLDDHLQGVTLVTRGEDLAPATHIHRLLQALLGLDAPEYHHHPLLAGPDGKRLAKRDRAQTLASLRQAGESPTNLRGQIETALGGIVQNTD